MPAITWSIGTIIALIVVVLGVILIVLGHALEANLVYGLIVALGIARLT